MPKFISVRDLSSGELCRINIDCIVKYSLRRLGEGTALFLSSGPILDAEESPEEIDGMIRSLERDDSPGHRKVRA